MNERNTTDVDQWRALMALSDDGLLQAWKEAGDLSAAARSQGEGLNDAILWETLIEGAAASRFGVGRHLDCYRARYS